VTELEDGEYTSVLDRFEEDLAVLLVEEGDDVVGELVVESAELPADGQHIDAVLTVEVVNGELVVVQYEEQKTVERADDVQSRFDQLSERPPSGSGDSHSDS
jgi:hypothetical protein